jgi:DNA repair exonuclease SbcCD ATPase subunit
MASQNEDNAGDDAGNPAEDAENVSPLVNVEDGDQENPTLNTEEGDAVGSGSGEEDLAAKDAEAQQAGHMLPNDPLEDGDDSSEFAADQNLVDASPADMNAADMNQSYDAAKSLQDEVNELKIELLSCHRNSDEAHERELQLQRQLDELSKQRSAEARASAEKISRLENRVAELQRQLEDATRQQQPSPSSDLRIRAAEVQELKARIKQYEIKLASSEEISSIRKEAEMERVRTDASWQHRMLSDQVNRHAV